MASLARWANEWRCLDESQAVIKLTTSPSLLPNSRWLLLLLLPGCSMTAQVNNSFCEMDSSHVNGMSLFSSSSSFSNPSKARLGCLSQLPLVVWLNHLAISPRLETKESDDNDCRRRYQFKVDLAPFECAPIAESDGNLREGRCARARAKWASPGCPQSHTQAVRISGCSS